MAGNSNAMSKPMTAIETNNSTNENPARRNERRKRSNRFLLGNMAHLTLGTEISSRKIITGNNNHSDGAFRIPKTTNSRSPSLAEDPTFRVGRSSDSRAGEQPGLLVLTRGMSVPQVRQWQKMRGVVLLTLGHSGGAVPVSPEFPVRRRFQQKPPTTNAPKYF
jgi:hypothetical protein